jgi:VanZ family protein
MLPLRLAPAWAAVGYAGVVLALVLSLWPGGVPLPVHIWDKIQHGTGYALLTLWFTGLYPRDRYLRIGLACFLLGAAIEALQGLTPTRSMDASDLVANSIGIAAALVLAYLALGGWAQRVERLFGLAAR